MKKFLPAILLLTLLLVCAACSSEPQIKDERMAKDYIGMTFGEIKALWGDDHVIGDAVIEGMPDAVYYEDKRTPYYFLSKDNNTYLDPATFSDDTVITNVCMKGGEGKPCELFVGEEPQNVLDRMYNEADAGIMPLTMPSGSWVVIQSREEIISAKYYYTTEAKAVEERPMADCIEIYATPDLMQREEKWSDHPQTWVLDPETGEMVPKGSLRR